MAEDKITKAIESANSSVSIETKENDSNGLKMIRKALQNAQNDGSFFYELVKLANEESKKEEEKTKHGSK